MASPQYLHGVETIEVDDQINAFQTVKSGVIGVIGTAPNRDIMTYPINEPFLVAGDPRSVVNLGSVGTLCDALDSMFRVARPVIVCVVIEEGANLNETYSNIVGNEAARTGVHAFRKANSILQLVPKLLIAPGWTNATSSDGLSGAVVNTGGIGYVVDQTTATVSGGGGQGASFKVMVNGSGAVQALVPLNNGFNYNKRGVTSPATGLITFAAQPSVGDTVNINGTSVAFIANGGTPSGNQVALGTTLAATLTALATFLNASADANISQATYAPTATALAITSKAQTEAANNFTIAASRASVSAPTLTGGYSLLTITINGAGTGAVVTPTLGTVANPVVAEILSIAPYLRAMAIVDGPNTTYADAVAYASLFDSQRLILIDGGVQVFDTIANTNVVRPAAPFAAALQSQTDQNKGFWYSFSNQVIPGVVGVGRPIDWSFTDPSVEGQLLNSLGITVVVQDSGFRFMGVRTVTSDTNWAFYAVRRTADMVYETVEQGVRDAIDKPISLGLLSWLEGSVNSYLRVLTRRGALLGGKAFLDKTVNTPADLKAGHVTMDYDLEPPAPMERLTFQAHRNDGYYSDLIATFLAQSTVITGS